MKKPGLLKTMICLKKIYKEEIEMQDIKILCV